LVTQVVAYKAMHALKLSLCRQ